MLRFAYNEISLTVVVWFHQLRTEVGSTSIPYNCCTVSVVVATCFIFPSFCDAVLMASMSVLTGHEQASGKNLTSIEEAFSAHMNHYASLSLLSPSHTYVYLPSTYPHTHIYTPSQPWWAVCCCRVKWWDFVRVGDVYWQSQKQKGTQVRDRSMHRVRVITSLWYIDYHEQTLLILEIT